MTIDEQKEQFSFAYIRAVAAARAGRVGRHARQGDSPAVHVTGPSPDRGTRRAGGSRSVDRLVDGGPEVVPHGQLLVAGV